MPVASQTGDLERLGRRRLHKAAQLAARELGDEELLTFVEQAAGG